MAENRHRRAQAAAARARNRRNLAGLPDAMVAFAARPASTQSTKGLAHHLGWAIPTVQRRFGRDRPVGGAYVFALCMLLAPVGRAIAGAAAADSPFAGVASRPRVLVRATAYSCLSVLMAHAALADRARVHARAGVTLRPADLALLDAPLPVSLAGGGRQLALTHDIPVLTAACQLAVGGGSDAAAGAGAMGQRLADLAASNPSGNVIGETNRFMEWMVHRGGMDHRAGAAAAVPDDLATVWTLVQLAEQLAADVPPAASLRPLFALLADEIHGRLG